MSKKLSDEQEEEKICSLRFMEAILSYLDPDDKNYEEYRRKRYLVIEESTDAFVDWVVKEYKQYAPLYSTGNVEEIYAKAAELADTEIPKITAAYIAIWNDSFKKISEEEA